MELKHEGEPFGSVVKRALDALHVAESDSLADVVVDSSDDAKAPLEPRPLSWDERRKLALDIGNLAPPDLPGVLLLVRNYTEQHGGDTALPQRELSLPAVTQWDASAAALEADEDDGNNGLQLSTTDQQRIELECDFDLDQAHPELLNQLRQYVDNCYVPHYVPKENCNICEGLWSSGRLIACGNDACDTRIHEECFGVVLRETDDGPWRCPSCLLGKQLMCAVCMQFGGALKPVAANQVITSNGIDEQKWVHALCAMAIPELVMRDVPSMEPVDGFEEIENGRFRYLCGICRKRGGASIICEHENCNVGMHPLCAGNAGLMVGTENSPLAVYCEKHLPASRIIGAKRLISDEDLVEEIMSENNSIDEDIDEKFPAANETQRYSFIFASTPFLYHKSKLLGDKATLKWGGTASAKTADLRAKTFANVRMTPSSSWGMARDAGGWKTKRPAVFPPIAAAGPVEPRLGVPAFPAPTVLLGAIVDFLVKEKDEWVRARVIEWDGAKQLHLVQIVASSQKLWAALSTSNTLVLYLENEENLLDGPRVRLFRPVTQGEALWRPKPRTFAASASGAPSS
ncbi:hypothetical protein Gpo141_00010222 [Globisporangium polare]